MGANTKDTNQEPVVHLIKAATFEAFDTACGERVPRARGGRAPGTVSAWRSEVTCDKCVPAEMALSA